MNRRSHQPENATLGRTSDQPVDHFRPVGAAGCMVRQGWDKAFRQMAELGDDELVLPDASLSSWDDEEWEWQ